MELFHTPEDLKYILMNLGYTDPNLCIYNVANHILEACNILNENFKSFARSNDAFYYNHFKPIRLIRKEYHYDKHEFIESRFTFRYVRESLC